MKSHKSVHQEINWHLSIYPFCVRRVCVCDESLCYAHGCEIYKFSMALVTDEYCLYAYSTHKHMTNEMWPDREFLANTVKHVCRFTENKME